MNRSRKPLILIGLNEVNLDLIRAYPDARTSFPNLWMIGERSTRSTSEERYEDLEPWIQWVSVHTGLSAKEHGVFRLGDAAAGSCPQLYERIEERGLRVGLISLMNVANRLRRPAYFLPDPWTETPTDGSRFSRKLAAAISQVVNDNSKNKISFSSVITLSHALLRFADPRKIATYFSLIASALGSRWKRSLLLDLLLHDIHIRLFKTKKPDLSGVFFNAGAHIQHHYMFNAQALADRPLQNPHWYLAPEHDPIADMAHVYERIVSDYLAMDGVNLLFVTGLTQAPYEEECYYWRLRDHRAFLTMIGVAFEKVSPRMTRDFLIEFADVQACKRAESALGGLRCEADGLPIFAEIDNRETSLFVTLTYPKDVGSGFIVRHDGSGAKFDLAPHVVFVALKNGMHDPRGYVYPHGDVPPFRDGDHVGKIHDLVMDYFALSVAEPDRASQGEGFGDICVEG